MTYFQDLYLVHLNNNEYVLQIKVFKVTVVKIATQT